MLVRLHYSKITSDTKIYGFPEAESIASAMKMLYVEEPDLVKIPHIAILDGSVTLRKDWSRTGKVLDIDVFPLVTGLLIASLVLTVASLAVSAYLICTMDTSTDKGVSTLPKSKDVFSFSGQANAKKLNEIVEITFGENLWFPPFYTLPLVGFSNNQTIMDIWLSLGIGDLELGDVYIDNTLIEKLPGCTYTYHEIGYTPSENAGDPFDLVYIGTKTNCELKPPDDSNYEIITSIVNPSGTAVTSLQINLVFNSGLYDTSNGQYTDRTVEVIIQYRQVDDYNNPITAWTMVDKTYTAKSPTAQRFEENIPVSSGRYEISIRRYTPTITSGSNAVTLISVYGKGYSGKPSKVNLLRITLAGSNSISTDSASKIKVHTKRKLKTISGGAWTDPVLTRNPIWAILEVLTAEDGGRLDRTSLDLAYWENLAKSISETFDTVITNSFTVWALCQAACSVFKGGMFCAGSDLRIAVDVPNAIPSTLFTIDNASDLTLNTVFQSSIDSDAIKATYVDPDTGLQATVQFTPPGSDGVNPKSLVLTGVTDRTLAWRLAAYTYQQMTLQQDKITFSAGLDGLIPMYGDIISIQWPFPEWAIGGVITNHTDTAAGNDFTLSEKVPDDSEDQLWFIMRLPDGSVLGPMKCKKISEYMIEVDSSYPIPNDIDYSGLVSLSIIYMIGFAVTVSGAYKVTSSQLTDSSKVSIEAQTYDTSLFVYDSLEAPAPGQDELSYPATPGLVAWIKIFRDSTNYIRILFPPAYQAIDYTIGYRYGDGTSWIGTTKIGMGAYIPAKVGILHIIVTGLIDPTTGPNTEWQGQIGLTDAASPAIKLTILNAVTSIGNDSPTDWISGGTDLDAFISSKEKTSIQIKVDLSLAGPVDITITRFQKSITFRTDDRGYVTFTKAMLLNAGLLYVGSISDNFQVSCSSPSQLSGSLLAIDNLPSEGVTSQITSVSTGCDAGLSEFWTDKYSTKAIKKYITISIITPGYPDALVNYKLYCDDICGDDQLAQYNLMTTGGIELYYQNKSLILEYMLKWSQTVTSITWHTKSDGIALEYAEITSNAYITVLDKCAPVGFLDKKGAPIIPPDPHYAYFIQLGRLYKGYESDTPTYQQLSLDEAINLSKYAAKVYRLDSEWPAASSTKDKVKIQAIAITPYGSAYDTLLQITSAT